MRITVLLLKKYRLLSILNEREDSRVYLVEHESLGVKRIIKQLLKSSPFYEQFKQEAHLLRTLHHKRIPQIFDYEENSDSIYFIEQYMEGKTLSSYQENKKIFSEKEILSIALDLCEILIYLHNQSPPILHLDIKPDNLILSEQGVMLIDFGNARYEGMAYRWDLQFGTPGFSAPELYETGEFDKRSDLYSFGVVLESLLSEASFLNSKFFKKLKEITSRCMHISITERFLNAEELKQNLDKFSLRIKQNLSNQIKHIAVAGSGYRMGVTHFSFLLCGYLAKREESFYIERNQSKAVRAVIRSSRKCIPKGEQYSFNKWNLIPYPNELEDKTGSMVFDLGVLSVHNSKEFLAADLGILLIGGKEWELEQTEQSLSIIQSSKSCVLIFPFLEEREYKQVTKHLKQYRCYRMPITGHPLDTASIKSVEELFRAVLHDHA